MIEGTMNVEFTNKNLVCPVCGYKTSTNNLSAITVSVSGYEGIYCMNCYAKWISENLPKYQEEE
jgi:formate dehydrogenase maturation protein FdhE